MMHTEVLTKAGRDLFPSLSAFADEFYLAGGTGLSLQLGHRVSVDFDLFSASRLKKPLLKDIEEIYRASSRQLLVSNTQELSLRISGVKFTFLYYPFPILLPLNKIPPISILGIQEILATKAYTIGRRGEFKDYIDIYAGLHGGHITLSEIIELAQRKYGDAFNARLFLEQLVYLEDVDATSVAMTSGSAPTKLDLIEYFSELIRQEPVV